MQPNSRIHVIIPILIIVVGVGWLLTTQGIVPGVDWVWTLGLGVIGIVIFIASGFDKFSVVLGPFFLLGSVFSVLRQTGQLRLEIEVPVLVISIGVLMLIAQLPAIPAPRWFLPVPPPSERRSGPPERS